MKPTKGKPSQSTPIRKGKVSDEEIKRTAEELTRLQVVEAPKIETDDYNKNPPVVKGFKPSYCTGVKEPLATPGNYKVYAEALKVMISEHETVEVTGDKLHEIFPQARCGGEVALQLKRSHGLSYRRVENGRNDTYVFFVEPTREELTMEIARLEKSIDTWFNNSNKYEEEIMELQEVSDRLFRANADLVEENTQLKSDLFYSQRSNIITLAFAIGAVITILFKSVAL